MGGVVVLGGGGCEQQLGSCLGGGGVREAPFGWRGGGGLGERDVAVVVKTHRIPFWLVGEFTNYFRAYFSGWIGMNKLGGTKFGF